MKIKFEDIPFEAQLSLRNQAVDICDNETQTICYCGRLATGFHTQQCRKFESKVRKQIEKLYNESLEESINA